MQIMKEIARALSTYNIPDLFDDLDFGRSKSCSPGCQPATFERSLIFTASKCSKATKRWLNNVPFVRKTILAMYAMDQYIIFGFRF